MSERRDEGEQKVTMTDEPQRRYTRIMIGLSEIVDEVAEHWHASDYPGDMQRKREQFRHAHIHAIKALGKIAAIIDHADHDNLTGDEARGLLSELPKLIADLVRCAAKMTETAPIPMLLSRAYMERAEQLAERWRRKPGADRA